MLEDPIGQSLAEIRNDMQRYQLSDSRGSTVSSLTLAGDVESTFDYDAFGQVKPAGQGMSSEHIGSNGHAKTPYQYTGMRYDAASHTTHHEARDYNASLRTWVQTDQYLDPMQDLGLSTDPLTNDRTLYAGGNPINMIDEDGHYAIQGNNSVYITGSRITVRHQGTHTARAGYTYSRSRTAAYVPCRMRPSCRAAYRAEKKARIRDRKIAHAKRARQLKAPRPGHGRKRKAGRCASASGALVLGISVQACRGKLVGESRTTVTVDVLLGAGGSADVSNWSTNAHGWSDVQGWGTGYGGSAGYGVSVGHDQSVGTTGPNGNVLTGEQSEHTGVGPGSGAEVHVSPIGYTNVLGM